MLKFFHFISIFYDFYKKHMVYPEARPNVVHIRLAEMERAQVYLSAAGRREVDFWKGGGQS